MVEKAHPPVLADESLLLDLYYGPRKIRAPHHATTLYLALRELMNPKQ